MNFLYAVGCLLILTGILFLVIGVIFYKKKKWIFKKNKDNKYAILIPARDESKVIENLLKSIELQNKDMSNVYVIVEDEDDPTCKITKKYKANIFVREKPIRGRKGYALDECLKEILKTKKYDLYFIFDADNILDKDFIKNMLREWKKGYDVAIGYRNILNPNNLISCSSGFMFILLNHVANKMVRMKAKQPIMLSGTGMYISGKLIEKWNGFPFYTLTEDYELSMYMYEHNIKSIYVEDAVYFDEQPLDMWTSIKQRSRWIKGFFEKRKGCLKDEKYSFLTVIGVLPLISICAGFVYLFGISFIDIIYCMISGNIIDWWKYLLFSAPLLAYIIILLITIYVMYKEKDKINMSNKMKNKSLFFIPCFLILFVISFFRAVLKKELKWEKVEHVGK